MQNDMQQLDIERVKLLYGAVTRAIIGGALLILFIAFIIGPYLETPLLITWVAVTFIAYLPRIALNHLFKQKLAQGRINQQNINVWENSWVFCMVIVLGCYSALLFFPLDNDLLPIVSIFLVILLAGSIMSCASSMKNVIAATITICLPLVLRFSLIDDILYQKLSLLYLACGLVYISYSRSLHDDLIENIRLKLDNESNSFKDPLTGLWNRRGLKFYMDKLIPHVSRHQKPYGLILLDIDHFKNFNDSHGHSAGDELLIHVADCLEREAREDDIVVRYGGEEFLIVLPDIRPEQIQEITERLFSAVRAGTNVTISAGLAVHQDGASFEALLQQADQALYCAKREGRNVYRFAQINRAAATA